MHITAYALLLTQRIASFPDPTLKLEKGLVNFSYVLCQCILQQLHTLLEITWYVASYS